MKFEQDMLMGKIEIKLSKTPPSEDILGRKTGRFSLDVLRTGMEEEFMR